MASLRRLNAAGLWGHRGNLHGSQGLRSVRAGDPVSLTRRIVLSVLRRWQFPLVKEECKVITTRHHTQQQQQSEQSRSTSSRAASTSMCEGEPTSQPEHDERCLRSCQLTVAIIRKERGPVPRLVRPIISAVNAVVTSTTTTAKHGHEGRGDWTCSYSRFAFKSNKRIATVHICSRGS